MSNETLIFFKRWLDATTTVGSVAPSSYAAARVMASQLQNIAGSLSEKATSGRAILEVGSGTGAATLAIVEQMQPEDSLIIYEIEPSFVRHLRQRFAQEAVFARVRPQVQIVEGDITQIDCSLRFDCIVCSIPFNNLEAAQIEAIFETFRAILKPGGSVSYIEYVFLGRLKGWFASPEAQQKAQERKRVLDRYLQVHEFRADLVPFNIPPTWVRHLRMSDAPAAVATQLRPAEHHSRLGIGTLQISTEALPWVLGLGLLYLLFPALRKKGILLWLAAAVAAFFRDPLRPLPSQGKTDLSKAQTVETDKVYAASDGKVMQVERIVEPRFGDRQWVRVVVFLSILDVHINRSPIAGKVLQILPVSGGFASANSQAAEHNHAVFIEMEGIHGRCLIVQRAGLIARRIVTWAKPGHLLAQRERFGLIRFGSRTDVYLPADQVTLLVKPGDRVQGGITEIARYSGV